VTSSGWQEAIPADARVWRCSIDGETREDWEVYFTKRGQPTSPATPSATLASIALRLEAESTRTYSDSGGEQVASLILHHA
jgi:hypothetical protein